MSEPKFTPGPWSVPHFAKPDVNCECGYVLTDGYMGAVATVYCSGDGDDWLTHGDNPKFVEAVANAHLIAAAPDMFMAAKAVVEQWDTPNWKLDTPTAELINALRAALSKANPHSQSLSPQEDLTANSPAPSLAPLPAAPGSPIPEQKP